MYEHENPSFDENYLCAQVALGFCYLDEIRLGWSTDHDTSLLKAIDLCSSAQQLADDHPDVLSLEAYIAFFKGDQKRAREVMRHSVRLSPHSSEILAYEGALFDLMGDYKQAAQVYKKALSLSPSTPAWIAANLGLSLLAQQESIDAEKVFKEVLNHYPEYARAWLGLTIALVQQGRLSEAEAAAFSLMKFDRHFTIQDWAKSAPFSDSVILTRFMEDLRAAGLVW